MAHSDTQSDTQSDTRMSTTDSGKMPDRWALFGDHRPRTNWKRIAFVSGGVLAFLAVLVVAVLYWAGVFSSTPALHHSDFLYFDSDGDVSRITVQSGDRIVRISTAARTTVEQSGGGFIALKAPGGERTTVNATNGQITVHLKGRHSSVVTVDAVQMRGFVAEGHDGGKIVSRFVAKAAEAMSLTQSLESASSAKNGAVLPITVTFGSTFATVRSPDINVTIENNNKEPFRLLRTNSTPMLIRPAANTTTFERRDSDEVAIRPTKDAKDAAQMLVRPSRRYVLERSALATLHFDLNGKEIFIDTVNGSRVSGWPHEPKFIQLSNPNITFWASVGHDALRSPYFLATTSSAKVQCSLANESCTVRGRGRADGAELRFDQFRFVNARDASGGELSADLNTSAFKMLGGAASTAGAAGAHIHSAPVGAVHTTKDGAISNITTAAANLSLTDELWRIHEIATDAWVLDFPDNRQTIYSFSALGQLVLTSGNMYIDFGDQMGSKVQMTMGSFSLLGPHCGFEVKSYGEAHLMGTLATVIVGNFPLFYNVSS